MYGRGSLEKLAIPDKINLSCPGAGQLAAVPVSASGLCSRIRRSRAYQSRTGTDRPGLEPVLFSSEVSVFFVFAIISMAAYALHGVWMAPYYRRNDQLAVVTLRGVGLSIAMLPALLIPGPAGVVEGSGDGRLYEWTRRQRK